MSKIINNFALNLLNNQPSKKSALLINPPIYDTQFWAEWAQPYGLLRIGSLLKKYKYKRIELFDFLETDENRKVTYHRINPDESFFKENKNGKNKPIIIRKNDQELKLFWRHFGKTWKEFEIWLEQKGFTEKNPPNEIFIGAVMTYWWEGVRDIILFLKNKFGEKSKIILGGIYPSLIPHHALMMTGADIIVEGEVEEANDLWPDLNLLNNTPQYSIITPSRGCPFNCSYCAQLKINNGIRSVRFRKPLDVIHEMKYNYEKFGIKEFAFYADFLLWDFENNLIKILEYIIKEKLPFKLYAPEGLDTKFLSKSQKLCDLLKEANFKKIYLPVESINDEYLRVLNRKHVKLDNFIQSVKMIEKAGFKLRSLEVNSFVLYGLPNEKIDEVVKTALFVSEFVGSIIPMLFSPVPSTVIYNEYLPYFSKKGWDVQIQKLNGKLFPFLEINEGSLYDYLDLLRMMYMLNSPYRSKSFQIFGNTKVSDSFLYNIRNGFENLVNSYKSVDNKIIATN